MFLFIFIDPQISQITQITLKTLRLCARILSTDFTDNTDYDVRLSRMSLFYHLQITQIPFVCPVCLQKPLSVCPVCLQKHLFVCLVCLNIFCPSVCLRCKNNTIHSNYRCFCLRFQHY